MLSFLADAGAGDVSDAVRGDLSDGLGDAVSDAVSDAVGEAVSDPVGGDHDAVGGGISASAGTSAPRAPAEHHESATVHTFNRRIQSARRCIGDLVRFEWRFQCRDSSGNPEQGGYLRWGKSRECRGNPTGGRNIDCWQEPRAWLECGGNVECRGHIEFGSVQGRRRSMLSFPTDAGAGDVSGARECGTRTACSASKPRSG